MFVAAEDEFVDWCIDEKAVFVIFIEILFTSDRIIGEAAAMFGNVVHGLKK